MKCKRERKRDCKREHKIKEEETKTGMREAAQIEIQEGT